MAKLSASALRAAAASAREKSEENADTAVKKTVPKPVVEEPKPAPAKKKEKRETAPRKTEEAPVMSAGLIHSQDGELKTEHVNLLITPSLSKKIEIIKKQGGFRSKNAAVIAILEAYFDAAGIE